MSASGAHGVGSDGAGAGARKKPRVAEDGGDDMYTVAIQHGLVRATIRQLLHG